MVVARSMCTSRLVSRIWRLRVHHDSLLGDSPWILLPVLASPRHDFLGVLGPVPGQYLIPGGELIMCWSCCQDIYPDIAHPLVIVGEFVSQQSFV